MHLLKYVFFLIICIIGNPFYQMCSYIICSAFDLQEQHGTNVFQIHLPEFIFILVGIFLLRLCIYALIFKAKTHPFYLKGDKSFLYIFSERHLYQFIGLISFAIWITPLEGNIIGFFVVPLTLLLGITVSIITIVRLLKIKRIMAAKSI